MVDLCSMFCFAISLRFDGSLSTTSRAATKPRNYKLWDLDASRELREKEKARPSNQSPSVFTSPLPSPSALTRPHEPLFSPLSPSPFPGSSSYRATPFNYRTCTLGALPPSPSPPSPSFPSLLPSSSRCLPSRLSGVDCRQQPPSSSVSS